MKTEANLPVRVVAATILAPVILQQSALGFSSKIAQQTQDVAFLKALCYGVCRYFFRLEAIASKLLKQPFKSRDADLYALLLIGLYQLLEMQIAPYAAVNETIEAARTLKKNWATNLLNACLRRFQREKDTLVDKANQVASSRYLHDQWMIDAFRKAWPTEFLDILEANNHAAPMTLRVNTAKTTREIYATQLTDSKLYHQFSVDAKTGIQLETPCSVEFLPKFSTGIVSVQDESAQLAAPLLLNTLPLTPDKRLRILDACCAPGGKTLHMIEWAAEHHQPLDLFAIDISHERLARVKENLARYQYPDFIKVRLIEQDLTSYRPDQLFDAILLDAPCSGTGVIRRHPDIKLLRQESDIAPLCALQQTLLSNLWKALNKQGKLLYTTCSILPAENHEVIAQFLERTPSAQLATLEVNWGIDQHKMRQRLPRLNGSDGFFYALLESA